MNFSFGDAVKEMERGRKLLAMGGMAKECFCFLLQAIAGTSTPTLKEWKILMALKRCPLSA